MSDGVEVGPVSELTPARCRVPADTPWGTPTVSCLRSPDGADNLHADLANGSIDEAGCLVCPWHGSEHDVDRRDGDRTPGSLRQDPGPRSRFQSSHIGATARTGRSRRTRRHALRRVIFDAALSRAQHGSMNPDSVSEAVADRVCFAGDADTVTARGRSSAVERDAQAGVRRISCRPSVRAKTTIGTIQSTGVKWMVSVCSQRTRLNGWVSGKPRPDHTSTAQAVWRPSVE